MAPLPEAASSAIARGVAAYVRATSPKELPATLRPHKNVVGTAKGTARVRDKLVSALDDDATRGLVAQWLDNGKPAMTKGDLDVLRLAVDRPAGWEAKLVPKAAAPKAKKDDTDGPARLEAERERTRRAKEDAKRARDQARIAAQAAKAHSQGLEATIKDLRAQLAQAQRETQRALDDLGRARNESDRADRQVRRTADKVRSEQSDAVAKLKSERKELASARRRIGELEREVARLTSRAAAFEKRAATTGSETSKQKRRKPLRVPKGRMEDDPATLDEWLENENVMLLVDGYNVAKADGGFGDLELEQQRDRVVQGVNNLARRKKIYGIVVFDGAEVPAGIRRQPRGPVTVEYSKKGETADDHLVALLESLPSQPVILVTNDRELQDRAAVHGATIARSLQLLALIR
jgi:predicted RNA-binding protein with PIN domain